MSLSRGQKRGNSGNSSQSAPKNLKTTTGNNLRDRFHIIERFREHYDDLYNAFIRKPTADLNNQRALLKYYKNTIAQYKKLLIDCSNKSIATETLKNDLFYSIATCCNYLINILSKSIKKTSTSKKIEAALEESKHFLTEMKSHFSQLTENYKSQFNLDEDIESQISIVMGLIAHIESHLPEKTSVAVITEESKSEPVTNIAEESKPDPVADIVEESKPELVATIAKKSISIRDEKYYADSAAALPELLTAEEKLAERRKVIAIPTQEICPSKNKNEQSFENLNQSIDSFLPPKIQNNLNQVRRSYSAEKISPSLFFQNQTKLQSKIITIFSKEMRNPTRNEKEKLFIAEVYKQLTMLSYETENPVKNIPIELSSQLLTWLATSPNKNKKRECSIKKESVQCAKNRRNAAGPSS